MTVAKYILLFTICSICGWLFESAWAIVRRGKWERRGFLYGPLCPIYGVGVVAIVLIAKAAAYELGIVLEWPGVFLAAFFGSMVLEYTVSCGLERLFHAYWWDYSDMPLNIGGRTCVPAACLFGAGGLLAVYVISPWWDAVAALIPPLAMELGALVVVVFITIDATLTVNALTQFQKQVEAVESAFNEKAGDATERLVSLGPDAVARIREGGDRLKEESERLRAQAVEQLIGSFGKAQRGAIARVKGFRTGTGTVAARIQSLLKAQRPK